MTAFSIGQALLSHLAAPNSVGVGGSNPLARSSPINGLADWDGKFQAALPQNFRVICSAGVHPFSLPLVNSTPGKDSQFWTSLINQLHVS